MSRSTSTAAPAAPARSTPARRTHDPDGISTSQKLMILVLSMTLFGVADIVTEIVPSVEVGPFELEVAYFAFIPVVLAALFSPLWVAIGAPLGEMIFSDMMLGDFSGVGEIEGFLQLFVGIYVAGCIVKDPRRPAQLAAAALALVSIDKVSSGLIDVAKVTVGIDPETLDEADGLLRAVVVSESLELVMALVITGVLFGALPAIWLAPRLYGTIEPLMGLRPRDPLNPPRLVGPRGVPFWVMALLGILGAVAIGMASQWEEHVGRENAVTTAGSFEPDFVDRYGDGFLWVALAVGVVLLLGVVVAIAAARARRRDARSADVG
ncbi:cell division protein FtsQ [Cellulosimicrobium terreum]|nr:cell division protein FtsQ [Cellulosimicrobium terreum]